MEVVYLNNVPSWKYAVQPEFDLQLFSAMDKRSFHVRYQPIMCSFLRIIFGIFLERKRARDQSFSRIPLNFNGYSKKIRLLSSTSRFSPQAGHVSVTTYHHSQVRSWTGGIIFSWIKTQLSLDHEQEILQLARSWRVTMNTSSDQVFCPKGRSQETQPQ